MIIIENLTESEELVMKAIWDCHKEPVLSDVVERVNGVYGKNWRPQTVSTFLAKLVRKNYLKLQRNGKIYTYKILIQESAYRRKLYRHLIGFWYDNSSDNLIEDMILNADLNPEELGPRGSNGKLIISEPEIQNMMAKNMRSRNFVGRL